MKLPKNVKSSSGFTLVELLVSVAIVGIVFGVIISSAAGIQKTGRDTQRQANLKAIQAGLQQYYTDQGFFPSSLSLSSSITLTDCTGTNVTPCTAKKIYIQTTPTDPTPSTTTPYCYSAQISSTNTSSCDNSTASTCQYYNLYANLENAAASSTCAASSSYDLKVTPS